MILLGAILFSCTNKLNFKPRLEKDAIELLGNIQNLEFHSNNNQPIPDIVNMGPNLFEILSENNHSKDLIDIYVTEGDLFGEVGNVTHSIKYSVKSNDSQLILRMRYDEDLDKFHIVGFTGDLE